MKKINLLIISLVLLLMAACTEKEFGPVAEDFAPPALSNPANGTTFVLTQANETKTMAILSWAPAYYGFSGAVTYEVQWDFKGNNFNLARKLGTVNVPRLELGVGFMNSEMIVKGAAFNVARDIEIRIKAKVHNSLETMYSNKITLKVTPFEKIIIYPKLYVPGSYQTPGSWDAANPNTVINSVNFNDLYEGYLWFKDADTEFKLLKVPAWEEANTIGDPNPSGTSGTLQIGSWGGNNIKVAGGPGLFKINANLEERTYSAVKTDWGVIGDATPTGWGSDTDMTYSTVTNKLTVTLDLVPGGWKFRANNDWPINMGDTGADGKLEYGGDNISVAVGGNYTITLDLSKAVYTYTIVKN